MKRILPLLAGFLLLLSSVCAAEAPFEFVDAHGSTGYYVDTSSISFDTTTIGTQQYEVVNARVAVIKAKLNRRFIYYMQFNPTRATYQILSSKVQQYDTKEILGSDDNPTPPFPYSPTSPMREIVDYIYEQSGK